MTINKSEVYKLYNQNGNNVTLAARKWCEKYGVVYHESYRKKFSKIINDKKKEEGRPVESKSGTEINHNTDKGTLEIKSIYDHAPQPEEIIRDHNLDIKKWKLSNFWSKQVSGGWRVSALFTQVVKEDQRLEEFIKFLNTYKSDYKPYTPLQLNDKFSSPSLLVLSLADFHIGKLDRFMIPVEERIKQYHLTVDNIVRKAYLSYKIDEICFVLGNDLLQTDSIRNETVKGTQVDASMPWDTSYEIAFKLMAETIAKLKLYCNKLTVVYIPGNHSASREYYITHALEVYFKEDKNIIFDRSSDKYKCFTYGNTALFLNHGDNINDKLPLLFAQTFPKEWGQTKYKEIVLGDKHHNSEKKFVQTQGEAQGVRMRIVSSLTGTDQWHYDNLFTNSIQAGIGLIYDKEKGKCAEIEHRI